MRATFSCRPDACPLPPTTGSPPSFPPQPVLTQPRLGATPHSLWTWSPMVLGTGSRSQDAQGGALLPRSLTHFPFVRKRIARLSSLRGPGFLLIPKSAGRCPPGNVRLHYSGDTSGAPSPSPAAPDTVTTVTAQTGEGISPRHQSGFAPRPTVQHPHTWPWPPRVRAHS